MATINASQDYDIIQTLTFAEASGTCAIRLYRGSSSTYTGTVKIRAGTSGAWSDLSVSGTNATFNVTSTTMQIAHDWNKSGNDYMTCSFYGQSTNLTGIDISQKAILSGAIGNYFMYYYARGCSTLTSLDVPDTSGIKSVGNYFMRFYAGDCKVLTSLSIPDTSNITTVGNNFMSLYAYYCTGLTSLSVPDTSSITTVGYDFMSNYAYSCTSLTSLGIPDTSSITTVGSDFMNYYAGECDALTTLVLPSVGWFATHNVTWNVPSARLNYLKGEVLDSADLADWQELTTFTSPNTLYLNYIQNTADVYSPGVSITIAESIGFQISLEYDKEEAVVKTVAITNSIGQQYTSTQAKSIPKTLSSTIGYQSNTAFNKNINATLTSSIGDKYSYTYKAEEAHYGTIANSIGYQSSLSYNKSINSELASSIGFNYRIRNVYPYIASEDFYLTKDENNTSVSGETNNFNLVGQKNNFNLVGK
jgi:hypothetical protein